MPRNSTSTAEPDGDARTTSNIVMNVPIIASPKRQSTSAAAPSLPKSPSRPKEPAQKSGRKSTGGTTIGHGDAEGATGSANTEKKAKAKSKNDDLGIDDLLLPRSLVSRLARGSLPPNTSLQKDALLALTKSATVFISYLAHTSNSLTSRKTIQAQDVLEAIREMELETVMGGSGGRLERELALFDEGVKGKRKGYRDRVRARESVGEKEEGDADGEAAEGREHEKKRVRRDEEDITMDETELDDNEADPSAQLIAEAARAEEEADGQDDTEADPDMPEDEDEDEDEDEEDDEDDVENVEDDADAPEIDDPRRNAALAPNGRVEIGSDNDDDSD